MHGSQSWEVEGDRLRIREGGGCLSVFGLPFFAAGVFLCLVAAGAIPMSNAADVRGLTLSLVMLMGVLFTAVGSWLVFGRSWTTLDGTRRTIAKQWGLLVAMRGETHALNDAVAVVVTFDEGDSDTSDKFPVRIRRQSGSTHLLSTANDYAGAMKLATAAARVLHLNIEDASTDHRTTLTTVEVELSVNERAWRGHDRIREPASRPAATRVEVTDEAGHTRIVVPHKPQPAVLLVVTLAFAVFPLWFVAPLATFFRNTKTPDAVGLVFLGFLTFFFGVLPALIVLNGYLRGRRGATIVTVSADRLVVEQRGAWRTTATASLAASDIFDVDYSTSTSLATAARRAGEEAYADARGTPPAGAIGPRTERILNRLTAFAKGRGVTVKSRSGLTNFGRELSDAEIRYLYSLVWQRLSGHRR
jgi:hypothetical protein